MRQSFFYIHTIEISSYFHSDPAIAPTKAIQNIYAHDNSHWQQPSRPRYDTTYRTEFINRIRHPVCILLTQWNCVLFFHTHND